MPSSSSCRQARRWAAARWIFAWTTGSVARSGWTDMADLSGSRPVYRPGKGGLSLFLVLRRRQDVDLPVGEELLRLSGIGGHVRGRGMRSQRLLALPLLDHHESVGAVALLELRPRLCIHCGAVLDAALLGAHRGDVGAEVLEDLVALAGLGGDDGNDVNHDGLLR